MILIRYPNFKIRIPLGLLARSIGAKEHPSREDNFEDEDSAPLVQIRAPATRT